MELDIQYETFCKQLAKGFRTQYFRKLGNITQPSRKAPLQKMNF